MSSFSSVIRKPGQKIVPKGIPRRNVQPRVAAATVLTPESQPENGSQASTENERERDEEASGTQSVNVAIQKLPPSPAEPDVRISSNPEIAPPSTLPEVRRTTPIIPADEVPDRRTENTINLDSSNKTAVRDSQPASSPHSTRGQTPAEREEQPNTAHDKIPATEVARPTVEISVAPHEPSTIPRSPSDSRKRRRITPAETPGIVPNQARISASPTVESINQASLEQRSSQSQSPEDLFRSATSRAASVSELANNIDDHTRSRSQVQSTSIENGEIGGDGETTAATTPTRPKRKRKKTIQEQAAEVVASAMGETGRKFRKRDLTPEDAETYELDPDEMTMGSLCKNNKLGKKSALEVEMEANWPEILQRRKEDHDKALEVARTRRRKAYSKLGPQEPLQATAAVGPTQMIVNGKIVVVNESREIDRNAQLTQAAVLDETNVREDKHYYKRVNQATVGIKANHSKRFRWDDESTQKFFKGLRMFGTDFMMIANMFPGLDRKQIKTKFIREENADKAGVMAHLQNREEVDLEEYSEVTNIELQDVQVVEDGIKAEEQRLRAEDNERRKREGFVVNEADVPLPSREGEDGAARESGAAAGEDGAGRFAELAADVMAPKKQRKTNASSKKRGPKAGRRPEGGIEEVLGSIDEVRV